MPVPERPIEYLKFVKTLRPVEGREVSACGEKVGCKCAIYRVLAMNGTRIQSARDAIQLV